MCNDAKYWKNANFYSTFVMGFFLSIRVLCLWGVIDINGKLLAGKYRSNLQRPLISSSHTSDFSQNSFYSGYLALAIKKKFKSELGDLHFQLTEFDKVKLLTIPLTSRNDRYL